MKKYSLQYLGKEVETSYRNMLYLTSCQTIKRNLQLLCIITLLWLSYTLFHKDGYSNMMLLPLSLLIYVGFIGVLICKVPFLFDWGLLAFQIGMNMVWLFINIFFSDDSSLMCNSYAIGYTIAYITQCYNAGSRTELKLLAISVNIAQMIITQAIQEKQFSPFSIFMVVSGGMYMFNIHSHDKQRRKAFLVQNQQEAWEQNLDEVGDIGIIQCTYDKLNNALKLHKANKRSSKYFQLHEEQSFREFSRNFILMIPPSGHYKEDTINLEQLLYYLFTDSERRTVFFQGTQSVSQSNSTSFQAKGIFQMKNYQVQIFLFWKAEQIAVIQISKFEETLEAKTMQFKLSVCKMAINSYQQQLQATLVPTIALLKKLKYFQEYSKDLPLQVSSLFSKLFMVSEYRLYESFRQNINILIFFRPKFSIKYQVFQPSQAINNALQVLHYQIQSKNFKVIIDNSPTKIKIASNYQLFHQLILNLLGQIMQVSKVGGSIEIIYHVGGQYQKYHQQSNTCIEFSLITNATTANELLKNQIWVLNPLSLRSCRKVSQSKQLNINLCISHYIVGLLGPYSKIEYIQNEAFCIIKFQIYKNLKQIKMEIHNKKKFINTSSLLLNPINDSVLPQSSVSLRRLISKYDFVKDDEG